MNTSSRLVASPTRRHVLRWAAAAAATTVVSRAVGAPHQVLLGPVDPRLPAPALALTLDDGTATTLPRVLAGRWTALQLMFTGCSATCPLQGAVFAELQRLIGDQPRDAQLLSISIDPLGDDARALAAWRRQFGAAQRWRAAVPAPAQSETLPLFLSEGDIGGNAAETDRHRAQTWLFDREGRLAFRCAALAPPRDIAVALRALATQVSPR